MNYSALIQNRKSFREFTDKKVSKTAVEKIKLHHRRNAYRLLPELETELLIVGTEARTRLEGAAGYHHFLVGAPQYMVLLSEKHDRAYLNAGFLMEDLILKLAEMGLDSCWLTFTDSSGIKQALDIQAEKEVVAIAAFGYGKKTVKRLRLNFRSMSDVDIQAKYRYMEPKRSIKELVFVDAWGENRELDRNIGFFEDMLWEALYAASLAPSYLNRQSYGFLLQGGTISLVSRPDSYNTHIDAQLSLGAVLLHFTAVAENWAGKITWQLDKGAENVPLPEGHAWIAKAVLS